MPDNSLSTKLENAANWDKYLKTIYLTLHDIVRDFYRKKYPDDDQNLLLNRYIDTNDPYILDAKSYLSDLCSNLRNKEVVDLVNILSRENGLALTDDDKNALKADRSMLMDKMLIQLTNLRKNEIIEISCFC